MISAEEEIITNHKRFLQIMLRILKKYRGKTIEYITLISEIIGTL